MSKTTLWSRGRNYRIATKWHNIYHCEQSVRIRSYSDPYFPAFRLNTERYSVSLRIQSECGKIWTRIASKSKMLLIIFIKFETSKSKSLKNSNSKHLENDFPKDLKLTWLLTKSCVFPIRQLVTLKQYMRHWIGYFPWNFSV